MSNCNVFGDLGYESLVGCCFLTHQLSKPKTDIFFMPIDGALENSTLRKLHDKN